MWNKGLSSFKGHQLAPGHSSLLCLAYFLQGHWTSEQEGVVCAGSLGKMDEVILQCPVPASCTLPQLVILGTSWIGKISSESRGCCWAQLKGTGPEDPGVSDRGATVKMDNSDTRWRKKKFPQ